MPEPVLFYERRFYCFSNFSSFQVSWHGEEWMTSEHAYQAAKFTSTTARRRILGARSAHDAKVFAHEMAEFIRPDWDESKLLVMREICGAKLDQHEFIKKRLRQTGDREIIEDSPKDSFWGWGPDKKGHNHLGKIWMNLREQVR